MAVVMATEGRSRTVVDPALLLRQVRAEVAGLMADIVPVEAPKRPHRIEDHPDGPLRVWADGDALSVFTLHDADHTVYVSAGRRVEWRSGTAMQWRPDWCALSPDEARSLGLALLGAVADVATDDASSACCRGRAEGVPNEVWVDGVCTWPQTDCWVNGPSDDASGQTP